MGSFNFKRLIYLLAVLTFISSSEPRILDNQVLQEADKVFYTITWKQVQNTGNQQVFESKRRSPGGPDPQHH